MSNTVNTSGTAALSEVLAQIDLGPTDSIQFAFAKLQLAQAQICKNSASEYMKHRKAFLLLEAMEDIDTML